MTRELFFLPWTADWNGPSFLPASEGKEGPYYSLSNLLCPKEDYLSVALPTYFRPCTPGKHTEPHYPLSIPKFFLGVISTWSANAASSLVAGAPRISSVVKWHPWSPKCSHRGSNPWELPKLKAPTESPWGHLGEGSLACNTCGRHEIKWGLHRPRPPEPFSFLGRSPSQVPRQSSRQLYSDEAPPHAFNQEKPQHPQIQREVQLICGR